MKAIISILIYLSVMVFTFGHSYNSVPKTQVSRLAGIDYTYQTSPFEKTVVSIFSSVFWPLYWSVELQK